ncbi:MAG: flagella basal body P-ring formation protein FlgA [Polyangiaceae bacterium]
MKRFILAAALIVAPALMQAAVAKGATPVPEVQVTGTRIHLSDVVKNAPADMATIDLGPAPAGGGSRLFERGDVLVALGDKKLLVPVPPVVRVVRKMHKLDPAELDKTTRAAMAQMRMWRGASLANVRAARSVDVPEGYDRVTVDLPKPPRRTGSFQTTAMLTFEENGTTLAKIPVPVELTLSAEAATPEITHGTEVQLVLRKGLIEVSTPAVAGADGDTGDVIAVTVRASNRVLHAKVMDSAHVLAVEGT